MHSFRLLLAVLQFLACFIWYFDYIFNAKN